MKRIPIGIDDFKELKNGNYYFIDKSMLIQHVIDNKLVLYARPRRFGKTLNMSMLYYFFSNKEKDSADLFDDLAISKNNEAKQYQNQYPVIHLDLKNLKNSNYQGCMQAFTDLIQRIIADNEELLKSAALNQRDKELLNAYYLSKHSNDDSLTENDLMSSLQNLTQYLYKHYGKKVIILIDEYDVPLQNAYNNGFYDEMVNFIKGLFERALKTNDALEKGVLTGCLRISKESIFTGLNNFEVYSLLDKGASDCYGFTEEEVKIMLNYFNLPDYFPALKEWYDGYLFGEREIYNPWSVLMYVKKAISDQTYVPEPYWGNSSGNDIVRTYIRNGDESLHREFERLMNDEALEKLINPQLTYREMHEQNNIYSFLLLTGYLKPIERTDNNTYKLMIPNKEVKLIYKNTFENYFREYRDNHRSDFINALLKEDCDWAIDVLTDILNRSISYHDNKESFYHGFMVGLLQNENVTSNKEAGDGRFDIQILPKSLTGTVIIIECKHSDSITSLKKDSAEGVKQIKEKRYMEDPQYTPYKRCIGFGISFYEKMCYIAEV